MLRNTKITKQISRFIYQHFRNKIDHRVFFFADIIVDLLITSMICKCIIFHNRWKKNRICHTVCHMEIGAYRMAHSMDISKSCPCKCDTCKHASGEHGCRRLFVLTVCYESAQICTDQFHCLFCHCIRKWRCIS